MLPNDKLFNDLVTSTFGLFPFRRLEGEVTPQQAQTPESLYEAFINLFHGNDAQRAKNVLFFWAVERPFRHEDGNKLESTIVYIEISKGTLAGRWPKRYFINITCDDAIKVAAAPNAGLQELADKDKNFSFYSRLIKEFGPLRVWYTELDQLNEAAGHQNLVQPATIRDWEKHLIRSYRGIHGNRRRPLKNRQD